MAMHPDLAKAIVDRIAAAKAGDADALAQLEEKARTGIDPLVLQFQPDAADDVDSVAAKRSAAAKQAWATRREAGWTHPKSRGKGA